MEKDQDTFRGVGAVLGPDIFKKIKDKKIAIVGLGGVGSWTVESLVRSGFTNLTIIDLDEICVSNINRQIHALLSTVGKPKAEVLRKRALEINPEVKIEVILDFITPENLEELIGKKFDLVIDAIDSLNSKVHLISYCKKNNTPIITSGAGGGRQDITKIKIEDLGLTINDKLLMRVRKKLKREHNFPKHFKKKFYIPCVYSTELIETPDANEAGKICDVYLGSLTHITGTMGFYLTHLAISELIKNETN